MKSIRVVITTPEKIFFNEEVESLVVHGREGELGILPGHGHLLAELLPGKIRVHKNRVMEYIILSGGFMEVRPQKVEIFTPAAELWLDIPDKDARRG